MDNWGLIAEFEDTPSIYEAAKMLRDSGYKKFEVYSPFPIHGMDDAMGIKPSPLPWIVLCAGLLGFAVGVSLSVWSSTYGYSMIISGKPDGFAGMTEFSPIIFELTILFSAFGTVFGMFMINKLPRYYRPIFLHENFKRVTDDRFFISVDASDEKYSEQITQSFLQEIGGKDVTFVNEEI